MKGEKSMGTFNIAHKYYCDFYSDGIWDEEKGKKKVGKYCTEERLEYVRRFYECLLTSEKMNELGKLYLTHSNISVRETVELYNRDKNEKYKINPDTGKSRIISCANKINNSFEKIKFKSVSSGKKYNYEPIEVLIDDLRFNENQPEFMKSLYEAKNQIDTFLEMFDTTNKNKKEKLLIKIPAFAKVNNLSEDEFYEFMSVIRPYSKKQLSVMEEKLKLMKDAVGYYNYIMTPGMKLTAEDQERRDIIFDWLGVRDNENDVII